MQLWNRDTLIQLLKENVQPVGNAEERGLMGICCRLSNGFLVIARIQGINGNFSLSCSSEVLSSYSSSLAWVDRDKRMKLSGFRVLRLEYIPLDLQAVKWWMWEICSRFTRSPFMPEPLHQPQGTQLQLAHHWQCCWISPGLSRWSCILGSLSLSRFTCHQDTNHSADKIHMGVPVRNMHPWGARRHIFLEMKPKIKMKARDWGEEAEVCSVSTTEGQKGGTLLHTVRLVLR